MNLKASIRALGEAEKLLPSTVDNMTRWLSGDFLPDWARQSLEELVRTESFDELNDRFFKDLEFGTGGMRGRTIGRVSTEAERGAPSEWGTPQHPAIGSNALNEINIIRATMGLFNYANGYLQRHHIHDIPKLVIAHDVRHFSRYFCQLCASTWTRLGGLAMMFDGPRSTPQLSFSVRNLGATTGVVITASHNPPHDNGFKAYFRDGAQIVEPHASAIIGEVERVDLANTARHLEVDLGNVVILPESMDEAYQSAVMEVALDESLFQAGRVKVVFTSLHGTGGVATLPILHKLGVAVEEVPQQSAFDPAFSTVTSPNPENAEALSMAIEQAEATGADLVVATDPDCDRMGVAVRDGEGKMQLLTGNMIGSVMAEYRISQMKELGLLAPGGSLSAAIIKTFVTTPLQDAIGRSHGLKVINTLTGFKWIGEKIHHYEQILQKELKRDQGYQIDYDNTIYSKRADLLQQFSTFFVLGCEESYGYLGSDSVRDKDGNAAVVMFCEIAAYLKSQGLTFLDYLDRMYCKYGYYFESLGQLRYEGAAGAQKIKRILDSYRSAKPMEVGGITVSDMQDFGVQDFTDADGYPIPKQDFFFLYLENGYRYAVRGSGTEPKIKFYIFGRETVEDPADLAVVKQSARSKVKALCQAILLDADRRAEEKPEASIGN